MVLHDGKNPFILIARVRVKEGMIEEYLKISDTVDEAVRKTEPGMLFHNFDSDPHDQLEFTWTEVYVDSDSLLFHIQNPPVQEYVEQHSKLSERFEIEIYGNVSDAVIESIQKLGIPLKHFKTTNVGYVRNSHFKLIT